jgi:hypothetical protein
VLETLHKVAVVITETGVERIGEMIIAAVQRPPGSRALRRGRPTSGIATHSVRLVARGLRGFASNGVQATRITEDLCLPAFEFDQFDPYAWPR